MVAVLALLAVLWVLTRMRRLREGQAVLLGDGKTDLVDFAVSLQGRIDDLHRAVDEIAAGLVRVDRRVDDSVTNVSIVRYDAYEDTRRIATSRRRAALARCSCEFASSRLFSCPRRFNSAAARLAKSLRIPKSVSPQSRSR